MKKKYVLLIIFLSTIQLISSQQLKLSAFSEISIITVGPGNALNDAFGHSAIRIKDPVLNFDEVYNYGMFDFNAPNFYSNFAKGKLLYWLGMQSYQSFVNNYRSQQRWMKEQILNLTQNEKQAFFEHLQNNILPQNSHYYYDPYFDNCATKLRDITQEVLKENIEFSKSYIKKPLTLRKLMNQELHWNTWGSFGINTALGSKLDKQVNASQYMYLPDYIYYAFKGGIKKNNTIAEPLIKKERVILNFEKQKQKTNWHSPILVFSTILLLVIYITYKDVKKTKRTKWLDFSLFFLTGIIGSLLVFLWFFTNHKTTPNNFNILWAFAPNLIISFFLLKKNQPNWINKYLGFYSFLLILVPIIWIEGMQLFPLAFIPFGIALLIRIYFLRKLLTS